jgi:integrase
MVEYKKKCKSGFIIDDKITVSEFFVKWYEDYVADNLAYSTKRRYYELLKIHATPYLGEIKLSQIKPTNIQSFYTDRLKIGLSPTTVLHMHRLLHLVFKSAVMWQYIQYNPVDSVKAPRQEYHEIEILSDNELQALLDTIKNEAAFIPIYIASTTGMRLGEVCGLQNSDVDFGNNIFYVRKSFKRDAEGKMKLKVTKTHRSKRPIPMLPGTDIVLKKYAQFKETFKLINEEKSTHFCIWPDGSPILPDYVTKVFKRYIRKLEYSEGLTFHCLRHTHASWLLKQGVNPKVIAERLGHTSVNILLNRYSHLIKDTQKDVISTLDSGIFLNKNDGEK